MKVVILAGGLGTRLSEETVTKPKPMVEIGGRPILWHIMNLYGRQGFNEFVVALGYKGEVIKDYIANYHQRNSDLVVDLRAGTVKTVNQSASDWLVHLVDTGLPTMTGGRLKRLEPALKDGTFMLTYGDGVSDIDLERLLRFHRSHGKIATVTAVRPVARFGNISMDGGRVAEFREKPQTGEGWINGGFFVLEPAIFKYLTGDDTVLEGEPMEALARDGELMAYQHDGFWQCMDTLRDKHLLERLWESGDAPWSHPGRSERS